MRSPMLLSRRERRAWRRAGDFLGASRPLRMYFTGREGLRCCGVAVLEDGVALLRTSTLGLRPRGVLGEFSHDTLRAATPAGARVRLRFGKDEVLVPRRQFERLAAFSVLD